MEEQGAMAANGAFSRAEAVFLAEVRRLCPEGTGGIGVALSGGADSVLLFRLCRRLADREHLPLYAVHVHHGIRGEAADADAFFCRRLAEKQDTPFILLPANAPFVSREKGIGLEEAAREVRYLAFQCFLTDHPEVSAFMMAHHAGDNAETFFLHLFRGSGLHGLCGIPDRRDVFLRPLLPLTKTEILAALQEIGQPYVTDESNRDTDFARNYVRAEILPRCRRLHPRPEQAIAQTIRRLRRDEDFLSHAAEQAFTAVFQGDRLDRQQFAALHPALAARVFQIFEKKILGASVPSPEDIHIENVISFARFGETEFQTYLPGGVVLCGDRHSLFFRGNVDPADAVMPLRFPSCFSPDEALYFQLAKQGEIPQEFLLHEQNVYKLLKQIHLSRDTMNHNLHLRHRRSGDVYRYGGMTHKVKRLFIDRKMTAEEKADAWILADDDGILWIPGFSVRDGESNHEVTLLCYGRTSCEKGAKMGIASAGCGKA